MAISRRQPWPLQGGDDVVSEGSIEAQSGVQIARAGQVGGEHSRSLGKPRGWGRGL